MMSLYPLIFNVYFLKIRTLLHILISIIIGISKIALI